MPWEKTSRKISLSVPTALCAGSFDGSGAAKPSAGESSSRCWASWSRCSRPVSPVLWLEPALGEVAEGAHHHHRPDHGQRRDDLGGPAVVAAHAEAHRRIHEPDAEAEPEAAVQREDDRDDRRRHRELQREPPRVRARLRQRADRKGRQDRERRAPRVRIGEERLGAADREAEEVLDLGELQVHVRVDVRVVQHRAGQDVLDRGSRT